MPPPSPRVFEEAERWFRSRVPMSASEAKRLDEDARKRAFWIAGVEQARVADAVLKSIRRAVRDGVSFDAWKKEVGPILRRAWGAQRDAKGRFVKLGPRIETVARTAVQQALNQGRGRVLAEPRVKRLLPFHQFRTSRDERVCPRCAPLDKTILPADSPEWEGRTPPVHYSCRCRRSAITARAAERLGGATTAPPRTALPGFGVAPDLGELPAFDLASLEPGLRGPAGDKLG